MTSEVSLGFSLAKTRLRYIRTKLPFHIYGDVLFVIALPMKTTSTAANLNLNSKV